MAINLLYVWISFVTVLSDPSPSDEFYSLGPYNTSQDRVIGKINVFEDIQISIDVSIPINAIIPPYRPIFGVIDQQPNSIVYSNIWWNARWAVLFAGTNGFLFEYKALVNETEWYPLNYGGNYTSKTIPTAGYTYNVKLMTKGRSYKLYINDQLELERNDAPFVTFPTHALNVMVMYDNILDYDIQISNISTHTSCYPCCCNSGYHPTDCDSNGTMATCVINPHHAINTASFSYSDVYPETYPTECNPNSYRGIWCAINNDDPNSYIQINLDQLALIESVGSWGRTNNQSVTEYKLLYSVDGIQWIEYPQLLPANGGIWPMPLGLHINILSPPFLASYIRFIPTNYTNWKSMKVQSYGISTMEATLSPIWIKDIVGDYKNTANSFRIYHTNVIGNLTNIVIDMHTAISSRPTATGYFHKPIGSEIYSEGIINFPDGGNHIARFYHDDYKIYWDGLRGETSNIWTKEWMEHNVTNACEYYMSGPTQVASNHVVGTIPISETIEISFNLRIKPNWICLYDYCNLLKISVHDHNARLPLIYIDGTTGHLLVAYSDSFSPNKQQDYHNTHLLSSMNNGDCHYFYFKWSPTERIFVFDDIVYENITNGTYDNSKYIGNQSFVLLSDTSMFPIPGDISNLCINTGSTITDNIYSNPSICPSYNVNECDNSTLNNCHQNATCTDTLIGFKCSCNNGFIGDGVSCKVLSEMITEYTTETYDNTSKDIVWVKIISCTESFDDSTFTYHESQNFISDLISSAISIKFVPRGGISNPNYDEYALIAKPGSNVIAALNDIKELSWTVNVDTMTFSDYSNTDNWIGSGIAKDRLWNNCYYSTPTRPLRSFHSCIYQACGHLGGLHIGAHITKDHSDVCVWEWSNIVGQDIEIFVGFEVYGCTNSTLNTCSENAVCVRIDGGFQCLCNIGYVGDGFVCELIDICVYGNDYAQLDGMYTWAYLDEHGSSVYKFNSNQESLKDMSLQIYWNDSSTSPYWQIVNLIEASGAYSHMTADNIQIPPVAGWFTWDNDAGYISDVDMTVELRDPIDYCASSTLNPCHENATCILTCDGVECLCNNMSSYLKTCQDIIGMSVALVDRFGPKNWFEAEKECQDKVNTHLASVLNITDALQLISRLQYQDEKIWIGLHNHFKESEWQMIDGTDCDNASWEITVQNELTVYNIEDKSYAQCVSACENVGQALANKQQILDYLQGEIGGDVWTPVANSYNDWLQIGGNGSWEYGILHTEVGGNPSWGTQVGTQTFKQTFYCAGPEEFFHCAYIYSNKIYYGDCRQKLYFLCNVPNGMNQQCDDITDCWQNAECCDVSIKSDLIRYYSLYGVFVGLSVAPAIAYYNSTLFVIGSEFIHYQNFYVGSNETSTWSKVSFQNETKQIMKTNKMVTQQYAQYESSLYILVLYCDECISQDNIHRLMHVDLRQKTMSLLPKRPTDTSTADQCIVTDGENVYVILPSEILIYNINDNSWLSVFDKIDEINKLVYVACSMTNNHQLIYIFGGEGDVNSKANYRVIKYNVTSQTTIFLDSRIMLLTWYAQAITAKNNNIYIFGGEMYMESPWKSDPIDFTTQIRYWDNQMIFNTKTEEFESKQVGIMYAEGDTYNPSATLAVYSDNVLIFYDTMASSNVYYLVTDLISINFEHTTSTIWPTNGFPIEYILNDFSNSTQNSYYFLFNLNTILNSRNTMAKT
eukprot:318072_1